MTTNWREVRESLSEAFDTFNHISLRVSSEASEEKRESNPKANGVEMVKSPEKANRHSVNPTVNSVNSAERHNVENSWEWICERAAILEFDGGLNRDEANHQAFMLWYRRFVEGFAELSQ